MSEYRGEDEALIGLARQLADAYGEARTREDQDYACDAIAEYLSEHRDHAPGEALIALLDLPLTVETYPLVDEAETSLSARGAEAVELLLDAASGDVYDTGGPAPERASDVLDAMDRRELIVGLVDVLCGGAEDELKDAAVDRLVALGGVAEPQLTVALDDARGEPWARAAITQIRYAADHALEPLETADGDDETFSPS